MCRTLSLIARARRLRDGAPCALSTPQENTSREHTHAHFVMRAGRIVHALGRRTKRTGCPR